jgi:hypothetical protein
MHRAVIFKAILAVFFMLLSPAGAAPPGQSKTESPGPSTPGPDNPGTDTPGPGSGNVILASDIDAIIDIAKGYGSATLSKDQRGDPLIKGRIEGYTYSIFFYDCEDHKNCKSIQFHSGFKLNKKLKGLESINDWNRDKRWAKAYLDQVGDPCIELDVQMRYGVARDTLDSVFDVWSYLMKEFAKHIDF